MMIYLLFHLFALQAMAQEVIVQENLQFFDLVKACSQKNQTVVDVSLEYQISTGEEGYGDLTLGPKECAAFLQDKTVLGELLNISVVENTTINTLEKPPEIENITTYQSNGLEELPCQEEDKRVFKDKFKLDVKIKIKIKVQIKIKKVE
eukprot:TRINITY_DN5142_c1_g3_i1.p1 TRINITY_DN5142_c1_g3~~TRINITY_DN5142_c1_g3_i1.p1  ORF type:complete len:149 (-),score=18.32 TRINITY_DN5142_c1_g3_i1:262-708(-)